MEQQLVEVAAAVRVHANNFAIQDTIVCSDAVRDLLGQQLELREDMSTPRYELAAIQRYGGPPFRCLIIGGPCWFPAPKEPPVVID